MSFYEALSPYYNRIFPLNKQALSFLWQHFQQGQSVLDIGAGTGSMAIALAEKGLTVTSIEPEVQMAEQLRKKAELQGLDITTHTYTMEQMHLLNKKYNGMFCIGNTLAHLPNLQELENFLTQCFKELKDGGNLILQLVNYDKVLSHQTFSFPQIEKEDFVFTRHYDIQDEKILFTTTISTNAETVTNTVQLFPITSEQLLPLLKKVGFSSVNVYGNYKKEPFTIHSPAFIVVAKKGE